MLVADLDGAELDLWVARARADERRHTGRELDVDTLACCAVNGIRRKRLAQGTDLSRTYRAAVGQLRAFDIDT
jgi:hypothetical protein